MIFLWNTNFCGLKYKAGIGNIGGEEVGNGVERKEKQEEEEHEKGLFFGKNLKMLLKNILLGFVKQKKEQKN